MDGITLHLLTRLDAMRETQLRHGQLLEAILARKHPSTPDKGSRGAWMPIILGAGQWAGAVLALAYLWKGGDAGTALAFLQKAF